MITVYSYGCNSCGSNGRLIDKAKRYATSKDQGLDIRNSKTDINHKYMHINLLKLLDKRTPEFYDAIMVEGDTITKLKDL